MYQNLKKNDVGGFTTNEVYWSSSGSQNIYAWDQFFTNATDIVGGDQHVHDRSFTNRIRAIRAFLWMPGVEKKETEVVEKPGEKKEETKKHRPMMGL